MLDLDLIELVTFDCFGTLLDWRQPLAWLGCDPVMDAPAFELRSREIQRADAPFVPYTALLTRVGRGLSPQCTDDALRRFATRFGLATPYPDSAAGLRQLRELVPVGVLSNSDAEHQLDVMASLGIPWDVAVLSEQVRAYKPTDAAWDAMVARVRRERGVSPARWLHVSALAEYDLAPARARGLATAWLKRPGVGDAWALADLTVDSVHALVAALAARREWPVVYEVQADAPDEATAQRFCAWMTEEHLAAVCAAPGVRGATLEVLGPTRFRARYRFARRADFETYDRDHAPALRAQSAARFGSAIRYTRALASVVATR